METVETLAVEMGTKPACEALDLSRATYCRLKARRAVAEGPAPVRPSPARALSSVEQQEVLDLMHCRRFVDQAPRDVYAALLDEGRYVCSVRTMYRILQREGEAGERRNQLRRPAYRKPELLAAAPNQVWSWDITKLPVPVKWTYYYLSGIGLLTPWTVHSGRAPQVLEARLHVLNRAYQAHPERFVGGAPAPIRPPEAVWINPPLPRDRWIPQATVPGVSRGSAIFPQQPGASRPDRREWVRPRPVGGDPEGDGL